MSDATITPPCSPPCGAQEVEEGELLDETQELLDMSDISDEEGSVREYQYDTTRYYRGGKEGVSGGVMVDSPASPDTRQEVTGSPLRIIPGSPQQDEGVDSLGEEEDLDEDILYLRLIALRSLAVEEKREQGVMEENKLAMEMQELLEEAEVAASEEVGGTETAVISEVITIDDDDEDPFCEMKLNLHESYMKFKQSVEVVDMTSPSYSPTQSPSQSLSPGYHAPGESPSPPSSPKYTFPLVDLTSPYSPSDDSCMTLPYPPPLPPLPPPSLSPPPPLPPQSPISFYPDPVPTTTSKPEEPLPPGEDTPPSISLPPLPRPPQVPQDMDIDSGDEAESNFFLSQQNLFPASVWGFSSQQPAPLQPRQRQGGRRDEERDGQVKRRRSEGGSSSREKKSSKQEAQVLEDEEEEESLRLLLLAQVSRGKGKPKVDIVDDGAGGKDDAESDTGKDVTISIEKCVDVKENIKPKVLPVKKASKPVTKAKAALKISDHKNEPVKPKPASRIISRNSSTSSSPSRRELTKRSKHKQTKISKADQRRFFPNLSKRVVVPLAEEDSESDEEEAIPGPAKDSSSNLFGLDLEAFLKQARNTSQTSVPPPKPRYVKKKIALTPQLKAKALKLTLADKKRLISSQISHLSRSKQFEYKRLKEILAKREKEKKLKVEKKQQLGEKVCVKENIPVNNTDIISKEATYISNTEDFEKTDAEKHEEDDTALRMELLQNMKTSLKKRKEVLESQKKGDSNSPVGKNGSPVQSPRKRPNEATTRSNLTVKLSGETRNVEVNNEKTKEVDVKKVEEIKLKIKDGVDAAKKKQLDSAEGGVVDMRRTLSTSLFKLSAYMSQLQKETIGVESGIKYAEELRRQLRETEELVVLRQGKVDSLREVIRESHKQITVQRHDMTQREEECRNVGLDVFGGEYKPPVEGAEKIRRKLEMIRNTALKVRTNTYSSPEPGIVETGSIVGGVGQGGLAPDYRSPLEHINQSARLDTVKLDHNTELCRFELAGKCLDEACQFQHCL